MATILHLSDLHLLPPELDEDIGDYKVEFIPKAERQSRASLLRNTLRGLKLRLETTKEYLDSIVISGDITYQGNVAGLELLPNLLAELGDRLPDASRIIAVPGNHDVGFGTAPASLDRYKAFIDAIRGQGYVTPRLDGIDNEATHAVFKSDGYLVAAMNSCDYSVAVEPLDVKAQENLDDLVARGEIGPKLEKELRRIRLHDAARINGAQLRAVADALLTADPEHERLRIATFHHQLLPVTLNEEAKTFESFSNLGEIRQFLADAEIDVVLHGHKHTGRTYIDSFGSLQKASALDVDHRCLIVSCGTIGAQLGVGHEVAKLIRVDSSLPRTRRLSITPLPALSAGSTLPDDSPVWQSALRSPVVGSQNPRVLHGAHTNDVHEGLEDIYASEQYRGSLICVVVDPSGAQEPPPTYPKVEAAVPAADWFAGQVRWWQSATVMEGKPFTHGDYIRRWRSHRDQLEEVVRVLSTAPQSSRAVVTLFDPPGPLDDQTITFPSFTLLAFKLRGQKLEATAFFRKQEMRYWWAINVAEIASLQEHVAQRISKPGNRVSPSTITTITSEVVFSEAAPKVAVPLIDQFAWRDPIQLAKIAAAVFDNGMPQRERELSRLEGLLLELVPPVEMPEDDPYVAVAGPSALLANLKGLQECHDAYGVSRKLIAQLEALVDKNTANASISRGDGAPELYRSWQEACSSLVAEIISTVRSETPA